MTEETTHAGGEVVDLPAPKKKKKEPIESLWYRELRTKQKFGVLLDQNRQPIIYRREVDHWETFVSRLEVEGEVLGFLDRAAPGGKLATSANLSRCAKVMEPWLYNYGRRLVDDRRRCLISTRHHVLELHPSGKLEVHDNTKDLFTRIHVDVALDPARIVGDEYFPAKDEEIESRGYLGQLITGTLDDMETRRAYQEFFGDTLTPFMRKAFPLLIGDKNSGKSQLLELAMGLHLNSAGGDLSQLEGFGTESFIGKSLVVIDELGKSINETAFKMHVGGSVISIQRKYMSNLSVRPDWKFLGGANELPRLTEKSGALETRLYPFFINPRKINRVDEIAKKILMGHHYVDVLTKQPSYTPPQKNDLLDWALNGAIRVAKRGRTLSHDELPKKSRAVKKQLADETNPTRAWIRESGIQVTGDHGALVPIEEAYRAFSEWCLRNGRSGLAKVSSATWLRDMLHPAMREAFGEDWSMRQRKATFKRDGKAVRLNCLPISFNNAPEVQHVDAHEAQASFERVDAWDGEDGLPEHIRAKLRRLEELERMSKEEQRLDTKQHMEAQGYVEQDDPTWGKCFVKKEGA